jgi:hypothetical protein
MKTRTHFAHRIEMLDAAGEVQEHLAGVEDYLPTGAQAAAKERGLSLPQPLCKKFPPACADTMVQIQ